jgi:hypothetical protein
MLRMVNLKMFNKENESGAVTGGILMWMGAAIMLVVMLPVLSSVLAATPLITSGPLNTTQVTVTTMVASSYGLIIVVLISLAAVIILGVIGYLQGGNQ